MSPVAASGGSQGLIRRSLMVVAFCAPALTAGAQTVVDDFSTLQAPVLSPPVPASSTVVGPGILGGERDLRVERSAGPGNVSVLAPGGLLFFAVDPGVTGELLASWDGLDGDALTLTPAGLGGIDLTAGGQAAFRLRILSATAPTSVVVEVWSDAARSSQAALVVPPVGAPTDFILPFETFAPRLGVGATFTSVGAVTLFVRGSGVTVVLDELTTAPASAAVAATATDGVSKANPGDTLQYVLTIGNAGQASAQGTTLASTLDPNTTLVAGSIEVSPLARDDFYGDAVRGTPFTVSAPGVLANDLDGNGDPLSAGPNAPIPTAQGGSASLSANGEFTYTPPAGFRGVDTFAYQADDGKGIPGDGRVTLIVSCPVLGIAPNTLVDGVTGVPYPAMTFVAAGADAPASWSFTGTLPTGMNLSSAGLLDGTPTQSGSFPIVVTATDAGGCRGSQAVTLTVNCASITVTNPANATAIRGSAFSETFTESGAVGTATFTLDTGALPSPLTLSTAGLLSGTPSVNGNFPITVRVTDSNGCSAVSPPYPLAVYEAPAITSANSVTFTVGTPGTFTVTTTGFPVPTITRTGALPNGVTFTDNGNGTGTLAGTAAAGSGGTYSITLTGANGVNPDAVQAFTLTVNEAPAITSANGTTFTVGTAGTFTVTTTGFPVPTITRGGAALPGVVTFADNGNGTGTLAGTPAIGTGGPYAISFTATNGVGGPASQNFTLTVNEAPSFTSANATTFVVGQANTFAVTTSGFPVAGTINASGALPNGVGFTNNGNGTGTLAGTPAASTAGTYPLTLSASNGVPPDASQAFTLTVQCPTITVAPTTLPDAVYNVGYNGGAGVQFTRTGGNGAITWGATGLPTGLTLSATGLLSGIPGTTGTFSVTVTATDAFSCAGSTPPMTLLARPRAVADSYVAVGNTELVAAGHSAPTTPFTTAVAGVLANDEGPGGTLSASPVTGAATSLGGSITISATGAFTYRPPVGMTGTDSYTYTVSSNGVSATASVGITVSSVVWYVNAAAGAGNGQSQNPFNTLISAQTASGNGHVVFVHSAGSPTSYAGGITLKTGQTLWGQGTTFTLAALTIPATTKPILNGTVALAASATVSSLDVSAGGATGLSGAGISGASVLNGVSVTTTTGTAVSLNNVTTSTITLRSVSATGATNGISLNTTSGSFEVTGDGASDPANTTRGRTTAKLGGGVLALGSGGTIQGTIGAAVLLNNAASVTLRNMTIQNNGSAVVNSGGDGVNVTSSSGLTLDNTLVTGHSGNNGLQATNLNGLTLLHTQISANATSAGVDAQDVWNVRLDNLTGTASVSHSLFFNSQENIVGIVEAGASTLSLSVTNSEFRDTAVAAPGNVGLLLSAANTSNVTANIQGSSFLRNRSTGFQYAGNDSSGGGAITLNNNLFEGNSVDTNVAHQGQNRTVDFGVTNNQARQTTNPAPTDSSVSVNTFLAALGTPSTLLRGTIANNIVGTNAIANSGSFVGQGISVTATGPGTLTTAVSANTVRQIRQDDAFFALSSNHTGNLNVGVLNNSFSVNTASGLALFGIDLTAGALPTDTGTLCANVSGNTATGDPTLWGIQAQTTAGNPTLNLQGYGGAANNAAQINAFLNAGNTSLPPAQSFIFAGTIKAAPASCPIP